MSPLGKETDRLREALQAPWRDLVGTFWGEGTEPFVPATSAHTGTVADSALPWPTTTYPLQTREWKAPQHTRPRSYLLGLGATRPLSPSSSAVPLCTGVLRQFKGSLDGCDDVTFTEGLGQILGRRVNRDLLLKGL